MATKAQYGLIAALTAFSFFAAVRAIQMDPSPSENPENPLTDKEICARRDQLVAELPKNPDGSVILTDAARTVFFKETKAELVGPEVIYNGRPICQEQSAAFTPG